MSRLSNRMRKEDRRKDYEENILVVNRGNLFCELRERATGKNNLSGRVC